MTKVKLLDYKLQEGFSCAYTYALFAEDDTQTAVSIRRDMFNRMDVYDKLIYKITGVSHMSEWMEAVKSSISSRNI